MRHRLLVLLLATLLAPLAPLACADEAAPDPEPTMGRWVRLTDGEDRVVSLDVAARRYEPSGGTGPSVLLAGAVHIGERAFYRKLQALLDEQDVVLYEGVNPSGSGELSPDLTDDERHAWTTKRLRLLAILVERYAMEHERYPASIDALRAGLAEHERHVAWLDAASRDGWGRDVSLLADADGAMFDLVSLGADAAPGGDGPDADLRWSDLPGLGAGETGAEPGLQARLAKAFRLRFQLDEMDESGEAWRNSDLSIDEVQRALEDRGVEDVMLFDLLDGSSGMAKIAAGVLKLIEALPGAAPRGRLMIMEMLALADTSTLAGGMQGGEKLVEVLIDERNKKVIEDLREVLAEPDHATVGVVYGAAHMPDLERRLVEELGYEPSSEQWIPAMRLPLERVGISRYERLMLKAQLIRQMKAMREMSDQ
jgi:hypothetical protein